MPLSTVGMRPQPYLGRAEFLIGVVDLMKELFPNAEQSLNARRSLRDQIRIGSPTRRALGSTVSQLKEAWSDEHARWSKHNLSAKRYVYLWVDGIHVQARLEDDAQCLLIIIGPEGEKELVGLADRHAPERPVLAGDAARPEPTRFGDGP